MLRITKIEEDGSSVTLKVEGRIMSEGVDVLELECLKWLDCNCHGFLLARLSKS